MFEISNSFERLDTALESNIFTDLDSPRTRPNLHDFQDPKTKLESTNCPGLPISPRQHINLNEQNLDLLKGRYIQI